MKAQSLDPRVRVTRTGDGWIVRVGDAYEVVARKEDITLSIRDQLRWVDKLGGASKMADASRHRLSPGGLARCREYKVLRSGTGPCRKPQKGC